MSFMKALKCRECAAEYELLPTHVCELCFGPLEVVYEYDRIKMSLTREALTKRPQTMWRYRELLPIAKEPTVGFQTGFTPLVRADRLAKKLGVAELYIKNDTVNYPTLSFKDRVVSVALSRARELGFTVASCASTGNLANSVAANAAQAGMDCVVFIPFDLEPTKVNATIVYGATLVGIRGSYDEVNRLCSEIANTYPWAFVNINMRPYYAEGSKTIGYEVCEQLGFKAPAQIVVPMASGSLLTKIHKSLKELSLIGLIPETKTKIFGAQATGCSPIACSVKEGIDFFKPVKPKTIAKSLAIGNPADGYYANRAIAESKGWSEDVSDEEIITAIRLLAETEGIFAETAGGVTLGVTRKLLSQGKLNREENLVVCITGNGLKTQEALVEHLPKPKIIGTSFKEFEEMMKSQ
jgi:threonine synthase